MAASVAAYSYKDQLLDVVMAPLHGEKLTYLTPAGGFSFIFQISMYAGLFAAIPLFVYHLHAFIKPALPPAARKSAAKVVLAATLLVLGGISYGYFIAIPAALEFLTTFASESVLPSLTADSYLNFFLAYVAGIAFLSLLPLFLMFLHWIRPQTPRGLLKSERWIVAGAFVVAAVITPTPDAVNQTMIAVPIILIYQLGVIGILWSIHKDKRAAKAGRTKVQAGRQQQQPLRTPAEPILRAQQPIVATASPQPIQPASGQRTVYQQHVAQPPTRPRQRTSGNRVDGFSRTIQLNSRPVTASRNRNHSQPRQPQQQTFGNALRTLQQPSRPRLSMDGFVGQ